MCGYAQALPGWGLGHCGQGLLLQYVLSGKGWVKTGGRRFEAAPGDVLFLDTEAFYELGADPHNPWEVHHISFLSATGHTWIEQLQCDRCPVFHAASRPRVRRQFEAVNRLAQRRPPGFEGQISALIHQIVSDLFSQQARARAPGPPAAAEWETRLREAPRPVRAALETIYSQYHLALPVSRLLAASGVSRSLLYALFRHHLKRTPLAVLLNLRIHRARELLAHTNLPCKDICVRVGIPDENYFSRVFRRETGLTARQYRAQCTRRHGR